MRRDRAPAPAEALERLGAIVGERHLLTAPELRSSYETDWSRRWHGQCLAVVRPGDTEEVSQTLEVCRDHGLTVVTQGGNTGLVGGSVPRGGGAEILLSTIRLNRIGEVDRATGQVSVGAGVTLAALQGFARATGYEAGLDLGARDSATVGGIAACDAGGMQAVRHGTARARIVGLEAVLADGSVIRQMSGLLKDNAGYHLSGLLVGSEGSLAVITEIRWRLVPALPGRATAMLALGSIAEAAQVAGALQAALPTLELLELMGEAGVRLTLDYLDTPAPMAVTPAWVLVECAARADPEEELVAALDALGLADRAIVAPDAAGRARLLRLREAHTEAVAHVGIAHKLDVGIPAVNLGEFAARVTTTVQRVAPDARLIVFGHLGDGNLHLNILGVASDDDALDDAVLTLVAEFGGTVSAEHGIGIHKPRYLPLVRSPAELSAMRAIKHALDPDNILNPGVILQ